MCFYGVLATFHEYYFTNSPNWTLRIDFSHKFSLEFFDPYAHYAAYWFPLKPMSHVTKPKKGQCHCVDFRGLGPYLCPEQFVPTYQQTASTQMRAPSSLYRVPDRTMDVPLVPRSVLMVSVGLAGVATGYLKTI